MVLKGLKLLLLDMQCDLSIVRNDDELKALLNSAANCPQLIIIPTSIHSDSTDKLMIEQIRAHYLSDIPVIMLDHEDDYEVMNNNTRRNIYFSDCSKPKQLRKNISALLNQAILPSQH